MRNFQAYLYQLFHERLYPLVYLGAAVMAAALASGNLPFPERFLSDLFGPSGGTYVLLCCITVICTFVGKDHAYRGFQSKVFCGASRISLLSSSFCAALLGVLPLVAVFPLLSMVFYRLFAGWNSENGRVVWAVLSLPVFPLSLLAFVVGVLSVCGAVFFLVSCTRDIGKSIGLSVLLLFLTVMLFQRIPQVEYLQALAPLLYVIPFYRMLLILNSAAVSATQVAVLAVISAAALCGMLLCSYFVCRRAGLK